MAAYNILIGMATGGTVRSETVTSLIGAMEVIRGHGVGTNLRLEIGGYVTMNRNRLVRHALETHTSHLLFIDNDMVFNPSAIQRLVDSDKDIVGVNYNARGTPGQPVVSTIKIVDPANDPNKDKIITTEFSAQLFTLYALGTGFMLIKTHVFEKMESPWFVAGEDKNGECFTEDVEFCRKAHIAGFDVWCNPTIQIKHIGNYEY